MSNFIPNKVITVNGKEPKWINNYIKIKIKGKNDAYLKRMLQNPQSCNISPIQLSKLVNGIEESINKYFKYLPNKLSDPSIPIKSYWSMLWSFFIRNLLLFHLLLQMENSSLILKINAIIFIISRINVPWFLILNACLKINNSPGSGPVSRRHFDF